MTPDLSDASAPRLRGCSRASATRPAGCRVGPAPAGVLRPVTPSTTPGPSRPRACGGAPRDHRGWLRGEVSAPRLRGCSEGRDLISPQRRVGPAPAGVLRPGARARGGPAGRPRACGGAPAPAVRVTITSPSAPRLRGCSAPAAAATATPSVGPAPAGVLRLVRDHPASRSGRPRACGGAPQSRSCSRDSERSAPRLRGCSVGR